MALSDGPGVKRWLGHFASLSKQLGAQAPSNKLQATSFKQQASSTKRPEGARHIVAVTKCLLTRFCLTIEIR